MKHYCLLCYVVVLLSKCQMPLCYPKKTAASIAIVGGGIAGISAAIELRRLGFQNVTIYEASKRLGGRVHPMSVQGAGMVDLGAQYVHGRKGNPIYRLAVKLNALAPETLQLYNQKKQARTQDGCIIAPEVVAHSDAAAPTIDQNLRMFIERNCTASPGGNGSSFGSVYDSEMCQYLHLERTRSKLSQQQFAQLEAMLRSNKAFIETLYACPDSAKLSLNAHKNYPDYSAQDAAVTLGPFGYQPILDYLIARLPKGAVQLNREVKNIKWDADGSGPGEAVRISMTDGSTVTADHVIVTSSLGYLKRHWQTMFTPALPEKMLNAIRKMGFGTVGKVILMYENTFWPAGYRSFSFIDTATNDTDTATISCTRLKLETFQFLEVHPCIPHCLIFWIHGKYIEQVEAATDYEVATAATAALRIFFNKENIPPPSKLIKTDWGTNSLFLGSYSRWSVDCDNSGCSPADLAEPVPSRVMPIVLFAGEATHITLFETVNGAYMTGIREANRIYRAKTRDETDKENKDAA